MTTSCLQSSAQYSLDIALRPFARFDTYVNAVDNELLSLLKNIVQPSIEPRQYFLWGAQQTGKSHLLQAICNQLSNGTQKAIYFPLEEIMNLGSEVIKDLHQLDVVCIDDIDQVLGKQDWDREIFLLINELRATNKSLVFTSTVNPNDINVSIQDLSSRLIWGPVYKLAPLNDLQKQKAIQLHANARGFEVSNEVSEFLLKRYPRGLNTLISLIGQLDQQSLAQQRKITVPFVKSVLENI